MGNALKKDTEVQFAAIKNGEFHNLATIEKSELSKCFGCDAYPPLDINNKWNVNNALVVLLNQR